MASEKINCSYSYRKPNLWNTNSVYVKAGKNKCLNILTLLNEKKKRICLTKDKTPHTINFKESTRSVMITEQVD